MEKKLWVLAEIILFIIMAASVIYYDMIKTGIVYLLLCDSLESINKLYSNKKCDK